MTAPHAQVLSPGTGVRFRRQLGLVSTASIALIVLFVVGMTVGVVILPEARAAGALFATAYLVGVLLSLRVRSVTRRARAAVTGDDADVAALTSARDSAQAQARFTSTVALLIVGIGAVFSVFTGDVGQTLLAILCALPMLSLSSVARSLARRLHRLLPP
jgi:hypothetical protein